MSLEWTSASSRRLARSLQQVREEAVHGLFVEPGPDGLRQLAHPSVEASGLLVPGRS